MAAPSSARSTLIGWIVATSIISIVSVVFAIYSYVEVSRANDRLTTATKEYADVLSRDQLRGDDISKLRAAKEAPNAADIGINSSMGLLDVALAQRAHLAKLIGGADETTAMAAAQTALDDAKAATSQPSDNLVAATKALAGAVNNLKSSLAGANSNADRAQTDLKNTVAATEGQINVLRTQVQSLQQEKDALLKQTQETANTQATAFSTTSDELRKQFDAANQQINTLNGQIAKLTDDNKKSEGIIVQLQEKLGERRVDPAKAIVRQADGQILSLPRTGICYINLGLGDHISPGLTFEVYNKADGVPAPGDPSTDEGLPVGKASIEVINVNPTSSECRITRLATGAALQEGDIIANLVYDKNTKYQFVVHGNFNLDQAGAANPQDANVIKQLITRWGGTVTDKINADTDFVVLGKEPQIPEKPTDPNDAVAQKNYEDQQAAYDAYGEISTQARSYRIPILNQNRFLYLCGYYDQAKR